MKMKYLAIHKLFFILLGFLSLGFAILGIFLPILPTTPLVLLAAYFFSKGSDRLHRWLTHNPYFGEIIKDWESYGIIPLRSKVIATSMIIPSFAFTMIFVPVPIWIKIIVLSIGFYALHFIWSKPETVEQSIQMQNSRKKYHQSNDPI